MESLSKYLLNKWSSRNTDMEFQGLIWILALQLNSLAILDKSVNISKSWFPHLQIENNDIWFTCFLYGFNELRNVNASFTGSGTRNVLHTYLWVTEFAAKDYLRVTTISDFASSWLEGFYLFSMHLLFHNILVTFSFLGSKGLVSSIWPWEGAKIWSNELNVLFLISSENTASSLLQKY